MSRLHQIEQPNYTLDKARYFDNRSIIQNKLKQNMTISYDKELPISIKRAMYAVEQDNEKAKFIRKSTLKFNERKENPILSQRRGVERSGILKTGQSQGPYGM